MLEMFSKTPSDLLADLLKSPRSYRLGAWCSSIVGLSGNPDVKCGIQWPQKKNRTMGGTAVIQ